MEDNPQWKGKKALDDSKRNRINDKRSTNYIPIPEGYDRHHKNGLDDDKNIDVLTRKQHMTFDGRLAKLRWRNKSRKLPLEERLRRKKETRKRTYLKNIEHVRKYNQEHREQQLAYFREYNKTRRGKVV